MWYAVEVTYDSPFGSLPLRFVNVPLVGVEPTSLSALGFESSVFTVSPQRQVDPI